MKCPFCHKEVNFIYQMNTLADYWNDVDEDKMWAVGFIYCPECKKLVCGIEMSPAEDYKTKIVKDRKGKEVAIPRKDEDFFKKLGPLVSVNPKVMGGVPCFRHTRVPVGLVIEHFAKGWNIKEIKQLFPDISFEGLKKTMTIIAGEFNYKEAK